MSARVVLLGPPGAGKGTQAAKIKEKRNIAHISTGDILRDSVKRKTEIGLAAKSYMDSGRLVPDDLMIGMIRSRMVQGDIAAGGFILDGFPRTTVQAEALDRLLEDMSLCLDAALFLEISDDEVVRRLTNRRVCPSCGAIYNVIVRPTKAEGICDACGGSVIQRDDDKEQVIRNRLMVYRERTSPLIDYYEKRGLLYRVDGAKSSDTAVRLLESIGVM
ncbi:MAG: adenylate kinase [Synergistaceae bacterium]|jgi:adenylate kinase|nr:adenylate kinase [Synergistaceae bacterium]